MQELLTDRQIKEKALRIGSVSKRFEFAVTEFLRREKSGDLYILADFFIFCIEILDIDKLDYYRAKDRIQYRLRKMKDKGLIDWCRIGSGWAGKTDFGMTSLNSYRLPNVC
ncbi:MAG TPA: hypothetical protein VFM70_10750 [Salinimicrobium sp.]|nr:hypothetical protein [Salinimicrobium sp.]